VVLQKELKYKSNHIFAERPSLPAQRKILIWSEIQTLAGFETEPLRMTMEEKKQVVKNLESKGVFMLKGVVNEVAKSLKVSEQTVYRYLKELEKKSVVPD